MKLYYLKEKPEYIKEFVLLCHEEWGKPWSDNEVEEKISNKMHYTQKRLENFPTIILLEENKLLGFVSLFEEDCDERKNLTPWYATLYVKKGYRGRHLSKLLNDAIIVEAKRLHYKKIYLKTDLENFYEKYGFHFLETISSGEKIYCQWLEKE
ncbi:MAG: GNAT family N-acetyltransferase [Clostridia bacterium]|nr:GNAT family N-acetyltransferase [Clostridia bacterium]